MGRGVLALIAVVVIGLPPATGFAQETRDRRDGGRGTARATSRGTERQPVARAARIQPSTQSRAPIGGRGMAGSNVPRQDWMARSGAGPRDDLFRAGPGTFAPRFDRRGRFFRHRQWFWPGYGYMSGAYFPYLSPLTPEYFPPQESDAEAPGYLRLQVRPGTARVYVDGYYVGTVEDFNGSGPGRFLEPGPHRIDIRAEGFETITFDVRIVPNETITYRNDLEKIEDAPQAAVPIPARAAPKTMYVIPRCYAGDTPPRAELLPAGCDPTRVRTIP